ncbi:MAG TPA: YXWGXW repeat-containing protein [Candidatus Eremiobacteraceae bacterium]|nr:YXWGXW repeat-containing protein [Candidatus Eremiobacteraceae bacterium]
MRKTILKLVWFTILTVTFGSAMAVPTLGQFAIGVSVDFAPPDLPVYEQPPCPGDDYIWTPGFWAWDNDYDDYYWVPGTWVLAPEPGFFWTPGYWAWNGSGFFFTAGYWGPVVGFYGGVNYGYGYFGRGYEGGRWDRGHFYYNREVNNVNVNIIHNTYNTTIVNQNVNATRVSYNGGNGGISVRATAQEEAAARERHIAPVSAQVQHIQQARSNPQLRSNENHGRPPIAATSRPENFKGNGVVAAREGGTLHGIGGRPISGNGARPENRNTPPAQPGNNGARPNFSHARDIPAPARPPAPNTGNPKLDQKYQQEQEKLAAKQAQEQQKLQQKQEQEHQNVQKQQANEAKRQQMEQRHQQQTQQMAQRHEQQVQHMQQRQQPPPKQHPQQQEQHPPHKP